MSAADVVIVEDEFLVAFQLEDILIDSGHHVVASVPDMASACAITESSHLALVDLNLRDGHTGPDIAHMLSERYGTRIIYVTANSGQISDPAPTAVGVVHKPFSREGILSAIAYARGDSLALPRPAELHSLESPALRCMA